ncbi:MAG: HAMP domain-containing histidine kinase [Acidobacteria bacterium]|nr:HAMP domain-containing histidine kinase [Acidobacteriota bacterium]
MKLRPSLLTKVLLVAFANLLLLAVAFFVLIRLEFRLDFESFLMAPAHDRILAASRLLALQLAESDPQRWDALIAGYAQANRVELRMVDARGAVLAGDRRPLPDAVKERFLAWHEPLIERRAPRHRHDDYELVFLGTTSSPSRQWVAVPAPIGHSNDGTPPSRTWIVLASSGEDSLFYADARPWFAIGAIVILVSVACWWPFVRGLNRAISRMNAATAQIAQGRFGTELPADRRDELGDLSASIHRMAAHLERLVNGQKRFLRDAAHELRSPLGRIQVALGLLERTASAAQRGVLADLREDVENMNVLVDDVLSYSRATRQAVEPKIADIELAGVVRRVVEREGAASPIETSVPATLSVRADPDLLFRALSNVVRNAVRYAGTAGPIRIDAKEDGDAITISVRDEGPGVPESERDAIFEPFYRLESARERATGGIGLGLAIVKSCVEACQGSVACSNRRPTGFEVTMRLPAARVAQPQQPGV